MSFDEPQTRYVPCCEISMLEINNNAVKFNFNVKTKVYEDEKSNRYRIQYLLSVQSLTNTGFESIQLTVSEVALLFTTLHTYTIDPNIKCLEAHFTLPNVNRKVSYSVRKQTSMAKHCSFTIIQKMIIAL